LEKRSTSSSKRSLMSSIVDLISRGVFTSNSSQNDWTF
jgi:hypothetical protein